MSLPPRPPDRSVEISLPLTDSVSPNSAAALSPLNLRCEGRINPSAIDRPRPALSWELTALAGSRNVRQSAFQLLVATSPERLTPELADRWASPVVESSATTAVLYDGRSLRSLDTCYWALRVRSESGEWSRWEKSGQWSMGLLNPAREWTAEWIRADAPAALIADPSEDRWPADPWFRREIQLASVPPRAVALVASIGFHELYVNGQKVGEDVLVPNVCDGSKRAFYVRYDLERFLRAGSNVLAFWLGSGWSAFRHFQRPGEKPGPHVSAQFYFSTDDAVQLVTTNAEWHVHPSPSRLLGEWDFQNFGGEAYDARAEIDLWAQPGLSLDNWRPATRSTLDVPLSADPAEPNRRQQELRPVAIEESEPGVYRVDFGRNFAGFVEVVLNSAPGAKIDLQFSEKETAPMTHNIRSEYIAGATGQGVFRNRFNYLAGRWMTLRGLTAPPELADIRAWCVRNDYRSDAHFESSNERLNDLVRVTRWTFENLTIGGFIADCPHRERMGYGGDGHASVTAGLYHYRLEAFLRKWNRDWHHVQGHPPTWSSSKDSTAIEPPPSEHPGEMPYTAPTYWGGGGPAWSGLCVHLPWQHYLFYGDRRVLEESLPVIVRWHDFLETKVSEGVLRRWGGKWDFLGDWLSPCAPRGVNSDRPETLFFNNCYRVWSLDTAARIARVLGRTDLVEHWDDLASHARRSIHALFYEPLKVSYADGSQVSLAAALLAGIPSPSVRPTIEQRLEEQIRVEQQGHICAGITGGAILFQYLLEHDRHDLLHLIIGQRTYPSWSYMLENGATTLWESWSEPTGNHSRLHSSFLYVGTWPLGGVLGLSPLEEHPGFARVRICPGPLNAPDLTWARGHYHSVRGRIAVAWRVEGGRFSLDVELPPGVTAEVGFPTLAPHEITETDRSLGGSGDLRVLRSQNQRTFLEVPSGTHRFTCRVEIGGDVSPA